MKRIVIYDGRVGDKLGRPTAKLSNSECGFIRLLLTEFIKSGEGGLQINKLLGHEDMHPNAAAKIARAKNLLSKIV